MSESKDRVKISLNTNIWTIGALFTFGKLAAIDQIPEKFWEWVALLFLWPMVLGFFSQ